MKPSPRWVDWAAKAAQLWDELHQRDCAAPEASLAADLAVS